MLKFLLIYSLGISSVLASPILEKSVDYRLPDPKIVSPKSYKLYIKPVMLLQQGETKSTFTGTAVISAIIMQDTDEIKLHAHETVQFKNENVTILVKGAMSKKLNFTIAREKETEFLIFKTENLKKYQIVEIIIHYNGIMADDMRGFYLSSYTETDKTNSSKTVTKYIGSTQMQSIHARRAFPCFDEPAYKASFEISVLAPKGYHVRSNMKLKSNITDVNGTLYCFEKSPRMSTYLVAFVISEFLPNKIPEDPVFNVWARPEARNQTSFAQKIGPELLKYLDTYTKQKYYDMKNEEETSAAMSKMDLIAFLDLTFDAMENWGCLTYRESGLLYHEKYSTLRDKLHVAADIAHEQAHQWFGDWVTMQWWENTWLNEGFASYLEYHALAEMQDHDGSILGCKASTKDCWDMKNQFIIDYHQTALAVDSFPSSNEALTTSVNTLHEIDGHFGKISYNKGSAVIRMMEHFINMHGLGIFQTALQNYLKNNKLDNSKPEDLFKEFQSFLPKEDKLTEIMENWIKKPGYPVVTVTAGDNKFNLKQERFYLTEPTENKTKEGTIWQIPIKYGIDLEHLNEKDAQFTWMKNESTSILVPNNRTWIIVNINSAGYYRVKYEKQLLDKIYTHLIDPNINLKFGQINKAVLVDDTLNLARAKLMTYQETLGFLEFLRKEDNYYPWTTAFRGFTFLMQRYADTDTVGNILKKHLLSIMKEKLLKEYDFTKDPKEESIIETSSRVNKLQWACDLGDENCISTATKLFDEQMNLEKEYPNAPNMIPVDVRAIVYCNALRAEKADVKRDPILTTRFQYLWNKYLASNVAAEKNTILNVLGCTLDKFNIQKYLIYSLHSKYIRKQDANKVFSSVYTGNSQGVSMALDFLNSTWNEIKESYGGMNAFSKAVSGLADRLTSEEQVKQMTALIDGKDEVQDVAASIKDTMRGNMKWSTERKKEIQDYLCSCNKQYQGCSNDASYYTASYIMALFRYLFLCVRRY